MREIVLDTETTGLDPATGDRIVEIGCLELINHVPTGRTLHHYINPERDMPQGAFEVHGLSTEFLSGYPVFAALADEILEFLGDAVLVIHNAAFDMRFINAELRRLRRSELPMTRALVTVQLARRKYRVTETPSSYQPRSYAQGKKIGIRDAVNAIYCIARYGLAD